MKKIKSPKIIKKPISLGRKDIARSLSIPKKKRDLVVIPPIKAIADWDSEALKRNENLNESKETPENLEGVDDLDFFSLDSAEGESLDVLDNGEDHNESDDTMLPAVLHPFAEELGKGKEGQLDPLTLYLKEISRYKLLSLEQEKALTKALAETGDIEIAKQLVTANLRLVVKIAMEYRYAYHNVLDLIQEGNIGLMKAVSKFDSEKGAKLSYYSSWWIRSYILKFILDNFRLVKIGTTGEQKKLFYNLLREKQRLIGQGINPETKLLSHNLGVSEKAVALMDLRLGSAETSIDRPLFDDGQKSSLSDTLSSEEPSVDEVLGDAQGMDILKEKLHKFLSTLKDRDREIFEKRLLSEIPPSLQSIAEGYGVSRERIRQVEERLIKKLKVYMSEFIR